MDKAKLLAKRGGTREVPLDVGTVTVKSLTRAEVKACKEDNGKTQEDKLISAAMVDPVLTPAEVAEWLDNCPAGESLAVMDAIAELSGLADGAATKSVSGSRGRPKR